jgi:diaminopimelate epimerase
MRLTFEKWQSALNDFVLIWHSGNDALILESLRRAASRLCDRRLGIGADGVFILHTARPDALFPERVIILNADGSEAAMCGNGLRCTAGSIFRRWEKEGNPREPWDSVTLLVQDRQVTLRLLGKPSRATGLPLFAVDIGKALVNSSLPWWSLAETEVTRVRAAMRDIPHEMGACDVGNRHLVFFSDSASSEALRAFAPAFQRSSHWDGINVHLAKTFDLDARERAPLEQRLGGELGDAYLAFPWERGVGETPACGSGAVAIASVAQANPLADKDRWTLIRMPGGDLFARRDQTTSLATLAGEAIPVFTGSIDL